MSPPLKSDGVAFQGMRSLDRFGVDVAVRNLFMVGMTGNMLFLEKYLGHGISAPSPVGGRV